MGNYTLNFKITILPSNIKVCLRQIFMFDGKDKLYILYNFFILIFFNIKYVFF